MYFETRKVNLIVICYLFLYIGCCSFNSTTKREYYFKTFLSEEFIAKIQDSVVFSNQNNQLHYFNKVSYYRYIDEKNECQHCCEDNKIEKAELYYFSSSLPFSLSFTNVADKKVDYFSLTYDHNLNTSANSAYLPSRFTYLDNRIQTDSIYLKKNSAIPFHESIKIINRSFQNVYVFEQTKSSTKIYPQKIYYSSEKGIVGIIFNNNDTWELVN